MADERLKLKIIILIVTVAGIAPDHLPTLCDTGLKGPMSSVFDFRGFVYQSRKDGAGMRILLAVDGSPGSEAAVDEVCRRPWPPESEVRVVTVLSPIDYILMQEAAHSPVNFDDILEQQGMEAAKRLSEIADDLAQRAPGLHVTPRLLEGLPKEAIVDEAEQWSADLIVIGSNGYGSIKRFVLGSVSLAVALYAPCSVEIVR